jgi:YVTN family beta-propeller protein
MRRIVLGFSLAVALGLFGLTAIPGEANAVTKLRIVPPRAPTAVVANPVESAIVLSWSAPDSDGGSPITGYHVRIEPKGTCAPIGPTSCVATGLKDGKNYNVTLRAVNIKGRGKSVILKHVIPTAAQNCAYVGLYGNLQQCYLPSADLAGLNLNHVNLSEAFLSSASLDGTNLTAARLDNAIVSNASLNGTDLTDAVLFHADLSAAHFNNVTWSNTMCPDGTNSDADGGTCVNNLGRPDAVFVGGYPTAVEFDGTNIWVANGTLSKINPTTNAISGPIPAGPSPQGLASDGTSIWVTNDLNNGLDSTVTKINATTGAVSATIPVGADPRDVLFDGTNIWVANTNSGTVSKINATTDVLSATIPIGGTPWGMAFDGTNVWVTTGSLPHGYVFKIDATTNAVSAPIMVGGYPEAAAFDGTNIWVINTSDSTVSKINATTGVVSATVSGVGYAPQAVTFDGTNIWVANSVGSVSKIDVTTNAVLASILVSANDMTFDGTNLWLSNPSNGTVAKIPH